MGKQVSTEKVKSYARQMGQMYQGENWLGESFLEKLKSVSDDQAFDQPVPGVHSVAEILWHCVYWRTVTIKRMEGDTRYRDQTLDDLNWMDLSKLKEKTWAAILKELEETQLTILTMLNDNDDTFLEREYAQELTLDFLMEGTIQHDAYHLGQIGLVLKILSVRQ